MATSSSTAEGSAIQRDLPPGLADITNKQNASTAEFTAMVKCAHIQTYSYNNGRNEGAKLCLILMCQDGVTYCQGVAKEINKDRAELKNLLENVWKENSVWKLHNIILHNDKPVWIHTNCRVSINLRKTKRTGLLQSPDFPLTPVPGNTIADILLVKETQRLDVMAIIKAIIQVRTSNQGLAIMDVRLIDGSRMKNGEYATLPTTFFFKSQAEAENFKVYASDRIPLNFMCMQATHKDGKVTVGPVKDQHWLLPAAGTQSEALAAQAEELCNDGVIGQDVVTFNERTTGVPAIDYNAEPATLTVAQLLDPSGPFLKQLLTLETQRVFQVNHVYWTTPSSDESITTRDGSRLFAKAVEINDWSGKVVVAARGKALLQMAGFGQLPEEEAIAEYKAAWERGILRHPIFCSIRLKVEAKPVKTEGETNSQGSEPTESQVAAAKTYNVMIVEAERVDPKALLPIPPTSLEALHTLLAHCSLVSDRLLAMQLTKLAPARFSAMTATTRDGDLVPFDKCIGLLHFTMPTHGKQHSSGIRVVGEKVQDATAAGSDNEGAKKYYGTMALASFATMGDFHLCNGGTTVLAVIAKVTTALCSDKHAADLHIETQQVVPKDAVPAAIQMLQQMQTIFDMTAADRNPSTEGLERPGKCRRLNAYPSEPLPMAT